MYQIIDIICIMFEVLMIGVGVLIVIFPEALWEFSMAFQFFLRGEEREPHMIELIMARLVGCCVIVLGMLCILRP